jgi:1-acyl-sn-glycerol-3-phosphate acyltransferase
VLRRLWRIPALAALLLGGLATVFGVFPWVGTAGREWLIATWSRAVLAACGARLSERVAPGAESLGRLRGREGPGQGRLLLVNHVSWLDIFAIDALAPASFAAKAEIAAWPLAGTLVARAGTVFIERGRRPARGGLSRGHHQRRPPAAAVSRQPDPGRARCRLPHRAARAALRRSGRPAQPGRDVHR